ncbi:MAG: hypothetical protein Fur0037_27720 [Planctomycetota bacterium]
MARSRSGRREGKLALGLALISAGVAASGGLLVALGVIQNLKNASGARPEAVGFAWMVALGLALVAGVVAFVVAWIQGGKIGARITDVGLAVSKLGRGSAEVRVRVSGRDEIGSLARSVQYLANDLQQILQSQEKAGGNVAIDPLVRQLRDKALAGSMPGIEGFEVDGAVCAGSRGGLDYYDVIPGADGASLVLVSGEGQGALSIVACHMAFSELRRALQQDATPRKALAHANRFMHKSLPKGVCAKATLLQVLPDGAKLYQAGARAPLWICARGEVLELSAEGIALGLDDGPVFEKALRPESVGLSPGTRLVLVNEAGLRLQELLDLVKRHSAKHTAMFMNMVLGSLEQGAGSEGLREDVVLLTAKKS